MSMGFAVALFGLASLATALLLLPLLLRQRRAESSDAYNLAVYRDQLAEIERDVGRGLIDEAEAAAARAEIGRRILALNPAPAAARPLPPAWLAAATVAILAVPFAALVLYWQIGSPAAPDQPLAARQAETAPHIDMAEAVRRLNAHLRDHPDDLAGWELLGRTEIGLGRYPEAVEAYRHAAELSGKKPEILGDYGEAQVLLAGGVVTDEAKAAFAAGLSDPEAAARSRYYLALYDFQHGDAKAALKGWSDLAKDAPADADWLPLVRQRIAEAQAKAGGGPPPPAPSAMPDRDTVAAVAKATANASPQEREAMIRGMVANLAAKLERNPDDPDGWVRLGRSYMVLGEPDKARDAYGRALRFRPDDAMLKAAYAEAEAAAGKK